VDNTNIIETNLKNNQLPPLPDMFDRYRDSLAGELQAATPCSSQPDMGQNDSRIAGYPTTALYRMLQYHMGWANGDGDLLSVPVSQGKALRPTLCLFACEALSEDWTRALPAAAALELIHNFSLIHDDIQDGDLERRHRPTVWSLWGQPQALVAGNAMRTLGDITVLRLVERGVTEEKALRTSLILTRSYIHMTKGQCLDLALEDSLDIKLEDYLTMVSFKTGALIQCGLEMGALIASGDENVVTAFANCGSSLGRAFQIRDDMLGIWGNEAATGKAVGNDIRRKKKSFPIVYALENASDTARQKLVEVYSKEELDEQDVQDVLTVLNELGVADYAQEMSRQKADLALEEVNRVTMPPWARQEIAELVEFLAARQY
jgi:geranylgeranyl diphosphate synthase type I